MLQPIIAVLPCMTGVTRCEFSGCSPSTFGQLLAAFPDLSHVTICTDPEFGDMRLCDMASCGQLCSLTLEDCHSVTPMGLLAMCLRSPSLRVVKHELCKHLTPAAMNSVCGCARGTVSLWRCHDGFRLESDTCRKVHHSWHCSI